jgi:hypothetical protein
VAAGTDVFRFANVFDRQKADHGIEIGDALGGMYISA